MIPHVPILRHGVTYRSLDTRALRDANTDLPFAEVSLANPGLVRRDAKRHPELCFPPEARGPALERAAEALMGDLSMDPAQAPLSRETFRALVSASTGLSDSVIDAQLGLLAESLATLSRVCSDRPDTPVDKLAVVLPSNALGVNRAWLPALVYGASVALKPGALDPFTPHRLVAALIHGGFPAEYFSVYPSGHETTDVLISLWPRVQLFGDAEVAARYRDNPAVQVNGPGRSALVLGADVEVEEVFEEVVQGICLHEGRTCLNTTSIAFLGAKEGALDVARKLAERLDNTPSVHLSERAKSEAIQGTIERALEVPGALRLTKAHSGHADAEGTSGSLLPTLLFCQDSATRWLAWSCRSLSLA